MGAAERHEIKQGKHAKAQARTEQRQKNRAINAELRRVPTTNASPLTREEAASAVAKKIKAKQDKVEERRSARCARCAVSQQRNASRLTKHAPPED